MCKRPWEAKERSSDVRPSPLDSVCGVWVGGCFGGAALLWESRWRGPFVSQLRAFFCCLLPFFLFFRIHRPPFSRRKGALLLKGGFPAPLSFSPTRFTAFGKTISSPSRSRSAAVPSLLLLSALSSLRKNRLTRVSPFLFPRDLTTE